MPLQGVSDDSAMSNATFDLTPDEVQEPKQKKKRENDERSKCWSTLVEAIEKDEKKDDFVEFVSSSLRQLTNEGTRERAKKSIKHILARALLEDGEADYIADTFETYDEQQSPQNSADLIYDTAF